MKFNEKCFNNDSRTELPSQSIGSYGSLEKKKMLKANHAPYITKALRKAIMIRYLENLYFKKRTSESMKKYTTQKNCSRLSKKQRRYFESFDS